MKKPCYETRLFKATDNILLSEHTGYKKYPMSPHYNVYTAKLPSSKPTSSNYAGVAIKAPPGRDVVLLGTPTTEFPVKSPEIKFDYREISKLKRYKLLATAKELLPNNRITYCQHALPKGASVMLDKETGKSHLSGIAACGLFWICPVCSAKISMLRQEEIKEALQAAAAQELQAYFVTFTASHKRGDSLINNFGSMKDAVTFMRSAQSWKKLRKDTGFVGNIDSWETPYGQNNGWHVHLHSVFFMRPGLDVQELEKRIYSLWEKSLSKQGLHASELHGVKAVKATDDKISEYLAKDYTLQAEMTSENYKESKGKSYSPMQLLALYQTGDRQAGRLFQEYAIATRGKSKIRFSRGLKALLGLGKSASDQELAESEQERKVTKLATFPPAIWQEITRKNGAIIGEMLVVSALGSGALSTWLGYSFGFYIDDEGRVAREKKELIL